MEIIVFGDSIAYGAGDKKGGWVQRLRRYLDEKQLPDSRSRYQYARLYYHYLLHNLGIIANSNQYILYNLSINGNNTEMLLECADSEIRSRLHRNEQLVIMFAIGTNDSVFIKSKGANWITPIKFSNNVRSLIRMARRYTSQIIFVGLTPLDESKIRQSRNSDMLFKNDYVEGYDRVIRAICNEKHVQFIEVFSKFTNAKKDTLFRDGVHPNSRGHEKIFEILKAYLEEKGMLD
jgi:lysophospholipase L1-like esterase